MPPPSLSLHFLGTASAVPSATRNHSALSLRVGGEFWLFDAGEATQNQIQRARGVRMGRIRKIFITHLHGDHVFGLAPLLASISNGAGGNVGDEPDPRLETSTDPTIPPVEIYGPAGLRSYIRSVLYYTHTILGAPYRVHELHFFPPGTYQRAVTNMPLGMAEREGQDIAAALDGTWPGFARIDSFTISAAPLQHSIPCVGFAIQEDPLPGTIVPGDYIPHLRRNGPALGLKNPISLLSQLQAGNPLFLPDGTILQPPRTRPGRKLVILGDTSDPSALLPFAMGADVLVHECTNAYIPALDPPSATAASVTEKTMGHGHSTPAMAGAFARECKARTLILNHFSPRYAADDDDVMRTIAEMAAAAMGDGARVLCAEDFMEVTMKTGDGREEVVGEVVRRKVMETVVHVRPCTLPPVHDSERGSLAT